MINTAAHLIDLALKEDYGSGDITTDNLIDPALFGVGQMIAKEPLVVAGIDIVQQVFNHIDPNIVTIPNYTDGDFIQKGEAILKIEGSMRALLIGERTALNFLQRLSGIATLVRSYVDMLENRKVRLADTRKTTPGWRVLEKYAVRVGGGDNHRMGLYDGVLIKDNHIAARGGIKQSIEEVRSKISHLIKIEVEVSDLEQAKEAVQAGADIIMLDNMDEDQVKEAVSLIDGKAVIEVSGNVTKNDLPKLADTGVDIISVGALTHSARCVDISMKIKNPL
ncbi:MAG: carboxylating nicotinate-nucleotide diphosphorylase [Deltaproteobacteria bacterium]|nr:carboxylating nicotinate-nucleotide diphosphorylase [Deltaproteobacteria bacterium]